MPEERNPLRESVLGRFAELVAVAPADGDAARATAKRLEELRPALVDADPAAVDALRARCVDADPILLESALGLATGDLRHFVDLVDLVRANVTRADLDGVNHVYWCLNRRVFLMTMDFATVPDFVERRLFPLYVDMIGETARRFDLRPKRRAAGAAATGRVVVVTNQFLSPKHQPSRDVLDLTRVLEERLGREAIILNTNMMPGRHLSRFVPPFAATVEESLNGKTILGFGGRDYRLLSRAVSGMDADKIRWFMDAIEWYDPDVVIGFGGSSIIADLVASARPTVCVPTTSGFLTTLADIALDYGGGTRPTLDPRPAASWRPYRFKFALRGEAVAASRARWGVSDEAVLHVVVGNRLDQEVDDAFIAVLERIVDRVEGAVVLFAGVVSGLPERLARSRRGDALRALGHVADIRGLLGVSDLFLNPRRTGGGGSAANALADGVVPISLDQGDVSRVVGPAFVVRDYEAMVERAVALAGDRTALQAARGAARARYAELAAVDDDGPELLARYLDEAVELFRRRAG